MRTALIPFARIAAKSREICAASWYSVPSTPGSKAP
jgi:hypothetical protein